ncbi:hypothetical protein C8Q76DRAFT_430741 [Earliella scabrosa]|nr:hypothetical protein C8Q76DRAFT_430741 [Earliella scabrosa]
MFTTTDAEPNTIAQAVYDKRIISSIAFALLLYDFVLTLPREVEWYSGRRHVSWASALFFLNRYGVMLSHLPMTFKYFGDNLDSSSCHQLQLYHAAVSMISQGVVSSLMVLRTYALYNFDPRVPMLFVAFTLIGGSTTTWALIQTTSAEGESEYQLHPAGCLLVLSQSQAERYAVAWSVALAFDVIAFCLTVARTVRQALAYRRGLFHLMLRDGAIFFGILVILYFCNVMTFVFGKSGYQGCLATSTNM